jgi:hypothetical protein
MKTRLLFCWMISSVLTTVSCAPSASGANANSSPTSKAVKETNAAKPTSSAATAAELTEKLKAANISPAIKEIVRMSEAGMDPAVIQAHVENSTSGYAPKAEEIIYLHEHGIPGPIITAMIQRGAQAREETTPAPANATPPAAPPAASSPPPAQAGVTYVAPAASPTYASPSYASSSVIYVPYSGYNYCYSRPYFCSTPYYYSQPYFGFGYGYSSCRPYGHVGFGYGYGYHGYGGYRGYGYGHCRY